MQILKAEKQILSNVINYTALQQVEQAIDCSPSGRHRWIRDNQEQFSFYYLDSITAVAADGETLVNYSVKWIFILTLNKPEQDAVTLAEHLTRCTDELYNDLAALMAEYFSKLNLPQERVYPFSHERLVKGMREVMEKEPLPRKIREMADRMFDNLQVETRVRSK